MESERVRTPALYQERALTLQYQFHGRREGIIVQHLQALGVYSIAPTTEISSLCVG